MLTLLTACSKRYKGLDVAEDNPEMTPAIAKARETLPQCWQVFDKREQGESDFALKVRVSDEKATEHFRATDVERRGGKVIGPSK